MCRSADVVEGRVRALFPAAPKGERSFPKARAASARLGTLGFEGDRCRQPVDAAFGGHGGPLKAVCLWSVEVCI